MQTPQLTWELTLKIHNLTENITTKHLIDQCQIRKLETESIATVFYSPQNLKQLLNIAVYRVQTTGSVVFIRSHLQSVQTYPNTNVEITEEVKSVSVNPIGIGESKQISSKLPFPTIDAIQLYLAVGQMEGSGSLDRCLVIRC